MKKTAITQVTELLNDTNLVTAHLIARVTGYTPQHVNRCLKRLYSQGRVAYTVVSHRGNAHNKRLWCSVKNVHKFADRYPMETPEYIQEELPL